MSIRCQEEKRYLQRNPWAKTMKRIKQRCISKNFKMYKYYGGRGIKNKLKIADLKALWFRDKAYLLEIPSIDRIDPDGHYEFSNCRYIEKRLNNPRVRARVKKERRPYKRRAEGLTPNDVLQIREKYSSGNFSVTDLSYEYGRHRKRILDIVKRVTWRDVVSPAPA